MREKYRAEIKKLTVDIDHLDAAIRLFDPNADTSPIKEYVTKHRAQKGSVKRFVLTAFREATDCVLMTAHRSFDFGLSANSDRLRRPRLSPEPPRSGYDIIRLGTDTAGGTSVRITPRSGLVSISTSSPRHLTVPVLAAG